MHEDPDHIGASDETTASTDLPNPQAEARRGPSGTEPRRSEAEDGKLSVIFYGGLSSTSGRQGVLWDEDMTDSRDIRCFPSSILLLSQSSCCEPSNLLVRSLIPVPYELEGRAVIFST